MEPGSEVELQSSSYYFRSRLILFHSSLLVDEEESLRMETIGMWTVSHFIFVAMEYLSRSPSPLPVIIIMMMMTTTMMMTMMIIIVIIIIIIVIMMIII